MLLDILSLPMPSQMLSALLKAYYMYSQHRRTNIFTLPPSCDSNFYFLSCFSAYFLGIFEISRARCFSPT